MTEPGQGERAEIPVGERNEKTVSTAVPPADPEEKVEEPGATTPATEAVISPDIDRASGPVRFVWRTDADGKFSQISPEFSRAVGAESADIVGRRFEDVANTFGLDPTGEIAGLLARRDTWSGRSVLWPVAGTDLKIPVDLAALPVYDRARNFEGFRGFGVARTGDPVVDPKGLGLVLVTPEAPQAADAPKSDAANDTAGKPGDPLHGEPPVLTIVPTQERRFTDKVIRLAEHRQPANDKGLSTGERMAFQQIGERLKKDSGVAVVAPQVGAGKPDANEPERAAPQRENVPSPDQAETADDDAAAAAASDDAATSTAATSEAADVEDLDEAVGDSEDISELMALDGQSGEAPTLRADDLAEEEAAEGAAEATPQPDDEAADAQSRERPVAAAEPEISAAEAVGAESTTGSEAAAPTRKHARPGMSLLDFAQWDQNDEPTQTAGADLAPAASNASNRG